MSDEPMSAEDEMATAVEARAGAIQAMRMSGILNMVTGLAFMLVYVMQSKKGQGGAAWIPLGALFLSIGGASLGRAKKLSEAMKARRLEQTIAGAAKQRQDQQD